jgi:hypothetical protein
VEPDEVRDARRREQAAQLLGDEPMGAAGDGNADAVAGLAHAQDVARHPEPEDVPVVRSSRTSIGDQSRTT